MAADSDLASQKARVVAADDVVDERTAQLAEFQEAWKRRVALADDEEATELLELAKEFGEIARLLRNLRSDVAALATDIDRREAWARQREEAKRRGEEARLLDTAFTDGEILGALKALLRKSSVGAAWAGDVARKLGAVPTQSDRVRAGQALSRLARKGVVVQLIPRKRRDRIAHLWSLPGCELSEFVLSEHYVEGGDS
jgi:hypothetical protein